MPRFCASAAVCLPMQTALTFERSASGTAAAKPRTVEALVNTAKSTSANNRPSASGATAYSVS